MGMMGGISEMISGAAQFGMAIQEGGELQAAADKQRQRELDAANVGIDQAVSKGARVEGQVRAAGGGLQARQRMAYTNSGVDSGVGTAAQVQANTAMQTELDAQTAKNNAALEVWGFKQQKQQTRAEHQARTDEIRRKGTASMVGGAGKFMGGAMSAGAS